MLFEDKAVKNIRLIYSLLNKIREKLERNKDSITEEPDQLKQEIGLLLREIEQSVLKESVLLEEHHFSQYAFQVIQKIKTDLNQFSVKINEPRWSNWSDPRMSQYWGRNFQRLIDYINEAVGLVKVLVDDIKLEEKMRIKALKLAKPELSNFERGCYHGSNLDYLSDILKGGLASIEIQKLRGLVPRNGVGTGQGERLISVFDPYTYHRINIYFESKGLLDKLKNGGITPEDFGQFFKENKDLNISRCQKINMRTLFGRDFVDEEVIKRHRKVFSRVTSSHKFAYSRDTGGFPVYPLPKDEFCFAHFYGNLFFIVIDDTAHLFPIHNNYYPVELLFMGRIPAKKIVGLRLDIQVDSESKLKIEILARVNGIPLYDPKGKLLWPLE